MKRRSLWICLLHLLLAMLLALPAQTMAGNGDGNSSKKLSQEELAQLLAPIALYPDELVSQILMASTYPLEVVQADRWAKSHKQSAGDVLAKQLEKEPWDPSVKSLVNFPTVLASMSEKLDVTTKIGDAFLSDQKGVMETIQVLRKKAQAAGNLKTTKEQQVVVEKEIIIIKSADPQVIYVPTYSPTVVYGTWMYPAYPPYYYYPPPPPSYPAYTFAVGIAIGAAWHNNSGHCDWHGNTVNINNNYNINRNQNTNINRGQGGQSAWKHNPEHRKGVAYKDGATAKQYGQSPARSQQGRSDSRGYGSGSGSGANRPSAGTMDRGAGGAASRPSAGAMDRGGRDSAFGGGGSGSQARAASDRGMASRQSSASSGFGGGGSRGGGGFSGGGGRSFGGGGGRGGGGRR